MKKEVNNENIFDYIESNMFSVLSSKDKKTNFNLLIKIKNYIETSGENHVNKEEIIDYLNQYILDYINLELNDEDGEPILTSSSIDKVRYKVKQFTKCGWLSEDSDNDFNHYISLTDVALEILKSLENIIKKEKSTIEYTGFTYNIYTIVKNFTMERATELIEQINLARDNLSNSLQGLNTRIKKFLKKLLENKNVTAESILFELTNNYGSKVAFTVFENLKSRDNPNKYSNEIISGLEKLLDEGEGGPLNRLVLNYIVTKKLQNNPEGSRIAREFFIDSINNTINFYQNIENVISFIDQNNSKYLSNTKNILNFILNNSKDVEGEINNVLKLIKKIDEVENKNVNFTFKDLAYISPVDEESLYKARNYKNVKIEAEAIEDNLTEEEKELALKEIKLNDEFSRKNINKFIMQILDEKLANENSSFSIKDFADLDNKSLIKFFLAFAYSEAKDIDYLVEADDTYLNINNHKLNNLTFRGK